MIGTNHASVAKDYLAKKVTELRLRDSPFLGSPTELKKKKRPCIIIGPTDTSIISKHDLRPSIRLPFACTTKMESGIEQTLRDKWAHANPTVPCQTAHPPKADTHSRT